MGILQRSLRKHHRFDAGKPEHRAAYWKLRSTGQQDEQLRFELETGWSNLLTMMQAKIADHFSKPVEDVLAERKKRTA